MASAACPTHALIVAKRRGQKENRMNWRGGLLRRWIILSFVWSGLVFFGDLWVHLTDSACGPPPSDVLAVPVIVFDAMASDGGSCHSMDS
jgi:hypothetical protein